MTARARWTAAACLGAALWLVAARPVAADSLPLPVRVEGDGVTVVAQDGMDDLAHEVAQAAPAKLAAIAADLPGLPGPEHVEIRLVYAAEDIKRVAPPGGRPPEWAGGVAYPTLGIVIVARRRGPQPTNVHRVVTHELAHMALGAALGGRAPRWLDEGFAYLHSSDWSMERTQTLTGLAWSGRVIPWWEIDRRFPIQEHEADRAYAQSYDFVAYLARRGRYSDAVDDGDRWPLRNFLAAIARGEELSQASITAYGTPFTDLAKEWFIDLRSRFLIVPASLVGLGVWCIAALLLIAGFIRRRGQRKRKLAQWELEEAGAANVIDV